MQKHVDTKIEAVLERTEQLAGAQQRVSALEQENRRLMAQFESLNAQISSIQQTTLKAPKTPQTQTSTAPLDSVQSTLRHIQDQLTKTVTAPSAAQGAASQPTVSNAVDYSTGIHLGSGSTGGMGVASMFRPPVSLLPGLPGVAHSFLFNQAVALPREFAEQSAENQASLYMQLLESFEELNKSSSVIKDLRATLARCA